MTTRDQVSGGRAPVRDAVSMQDAVGRFLRASGLGARMRGWPVFQAWIDAAGPELARHARPVRFERGELVVEVVSAAHYQELASFTGEGYRQRANERLARPEIRRIVFRLKR
jgi:Dna[CI] antecedent, DciA